MPSDALADRVAAVVRELELLAVQRTVSKQRLRELIARLDDVQLAMRRRGEPTADEPVDLRVLATEQQLRRQARESIARPGSGVSRDG